MNRRKASAGQLGRVQLEIMKVLWDLKSATAREITDCMSSSGLSHSSIQTLLRTLEDKGLVEHESVDRVFIFKPTCDAESIATSSTRDLLTRLFQGSPYRLVAHLLKNEQVSKEEIYQLRMLIEQHEKEQTK